MQSGPFAPSGTLATLEMSPAGAGLSDARFDFSGPYSGTGLPASLVALGMGDGETRTTGVGIATWETIEGGGAGEGIITTSVAHGMWTTGSPETFTVSGTGVEWDDAGPYIDGQHGGTYVSAFDDIFTTDDSGTGGTLTYSQPRLAAWGGFTESTIAEQMRLGTLRWESNGSTGTGLDYGSTLTTGTSWTIFLCASGNPASVPYLISNGAGTNGIRIVSATTINVYTSTGTHTFTVATIVSGTLMQIVVRGSGTQLALWVNGTAATPKAVDAGTIGTRYIARLTAVYYAVGINALRIYNAELTAAQINQVATAIAGTAGLTWTPI